MVRTALLVLAALLVALAPVAAQDAHVWTSQRPDGHAPLGIRADRAVGQGEIQVSYRFSKLDDRGVWFDNDSLPLSNTLEMYDVAPLTLDDLRHEVEVAYGLTEDLTLLGRVRYHRLERQQLSTDGFLYITEADGLGDTEVAALYNVYRQGPYTANARAGLSIPTGKEDVTAVTPFSAPFEEPLSYDMRPGAGVFAALPGMTAQVQNEFGTVGAQVDARIHFGTNDSGYKPGDRLSFTTWASYRLSDSFSASARLDYETWGRVDGEDPDLDFNRDPGNDGFFAEGSLLSIPLGINFLMPEGSALEGHRLAVEYIWPIDQSYEGPQLGFSRGLVLGWQASF